MRVAGRKPRELVKEKGRRGGKAVPGRGSGGAPPVHELEEPVFVHLEHVVLLEQGAQLLNQRGIAGRRGKGAFNLLPRFARKPRLLVLEEVLLGHVVDVLASRKINFS